MSADLVVNLNPEAEAVPVQRVLEVQWLNHDQGPRPVSVPHHFKLVCTKPTIFQHLKEI